MRNKNPSKAIEIRIGAIDALSEILENNQNAGISINFISNKKNIRGRDKSLLSQIVFGVLKNLSFLDYILIKLLKSGKFPSKIGTNALRIGAYQIAFTNIPDYAAVDSTVESVRSFDAKEREIALVNAVLRNFIRKWKCIKLPENTLDYLSVKYSHPVWLVERWLERYGKEIVEKLLSANNLPPPKTFRINTLRISIAELKKSLAENGIKYSDTQFDEFFNLDEKISPNDFAPFRDGYVSVQDAAFAIPIILLDPHSDEKILEIGAAPGGKTTHIIEKLVGKTENFFAGDISYRRNLSILQNLKRLKHPTPAIITFDARTMPFMPRTFDKIFIDAPCSSFGVIRRHPEIRWFRKIEDIKRLAKIQSKIIRSAYTILKDGGTLIFTTCTTEPEENRGAIRTIQRLGMKFTPISSYILSKFIESDSLGVRTYPHRDNFDGSFTVCAKKK